MDAKQDKIGALLTAKQGEVIATLRRGGVLEADIPDKTQEVLEKAFLYCQAEGLIEEKLGGLLHTIAKRTALDYRHYARMRTTKEPALVIQEDRPPSTPEKDLGELELFAVLWEVIRSLRQPLQTVYQLRFVQRLKIREIAPMLRVSEATVDRYIAELADEVRKALKRKGITTPLLLPFAGFRQDNGGQGEGQGESGNQEKSEPRLALVLPSSGNSQPQEKKESKKEPESRTRRLIRGFFHAAAGGFIVWLLLRHAAAANHVTPIIRVSSGFLSAASSTVAAGILTDRATCPICPEPTVITVAAPPSPATCAGAPVPGHEKETDSTPRHIAMICNGAIERNDRDDIRTWCARTVEPYASILKPRAARRLAE